jgi:hypothetical protein
MCAAGGVAVLILKQKQQQQLCYVRMISEGNDSEW